MTMHGGGFSAARPQRPLTERRTGVVGTGRSWKPGSFAVLEASEQAACPAIGAADGFRHFVRRPKPEERCRWLIDPQQPDAAHKVRQTLSSLVKRMRTGFWPEGPARDNPEIPSGYTYLLQFVAHDLVQSSLAVSADPRFGAMCHNLRDTRLQLATLYGGGPIGIPAIYAIDDPLIQTRDSFRRGPMRNADGSPGPLRDLPRAAGALVCGKPLAGLSETLVADPRNDHHAIVSQLTGLMQLLHNALVKLLPSSSEGTHPEAAALHRYLCARDATTQVYHTIVRNDLLRRLLTPLVYRRYDETPDPFIDRQRNGIPLEFSHAAFRIGHAMVRDSYVVNDAAGRAEQLDDLLARTSGRAPRLMPLNASWIVQWSKFFDLRKGQPNFSQRLGPQFSGGLSSERLFPQVDETQELGLPYRDLVSGAVVGLWSVDALADVIKVKSPDLMAGRSLLADRQHRQASLRDWLGQPAAQGVVPPDEIEALASDPPLPFFVLFEAASEEDGLRLGTLGSIIVADVIFRELGPAVRRSLPERLADISFRYFARNFLASVPDINTMSGLVRFVAEAEELGAAVPDFV